MRNHLVGLAYVHPNGIKSETIWVNPFYVIRVIDSGADHPITKTPRTIVVFGNDSITVAAPSRIWTTSSTTAKRAGAKIQRTVR